MKWTEFLLCLSFLFLPRVGEIGQEGESSSTLTHLAHVTQASTYTGDVQVGAPTQIGNAPASVPRWTAEQEEQLRATRSTTDGTTG